MSTILLTTYYLLIPCSYLQVYTNITVACQTTEVILQLPFLLPSYRLHLPCADHHLSTHHGMGNKASVSCTSTSSNSSRCQLTPVTIGLIDCTVITTVRFLTAALVIIAAQLKQVIPPPYFYFLLNMSYKAPTLP